MRVVSPPAPLAQGDVGWITGFAADGYGVILHTTDGGKNWTRQGSLNTIPNVILYDVRAIDAYSAWAVGDADGNYAVILRTMDGGKTWIRCGAPGSVPDFGALGIGAVDSNIAWVVGNNGTIIHTEDGGKTWVQQASNTNAPLMKVAVVDRYNAWIVGDTDNGYAVILRTRDGGLTWTRQGNASTVKTIGLIDVTAVDNRTAWAVGVDYAVLKTMDVGASWQIQMLNLSGIGHMNGACAIDKYNAWITQDYGDVYWTSDGGKTWNEQKPAVASGGWLLSVSARSLKKAWVVGISQSGRGGIIMHTTNRGVNWTEQFAPVNVPFDRISFVGTRS
ncbi:MAG: YCF48-related protein [Methanotrichaceae archaeon]